MKECDRRWLASRVDADDYPTRDDIDATLVCFPPRRGIHDALGKRAAMGTTTMTRSRENIQRIRSIDRLTDVVSRTLSPWRGTTPLTE